MDFNAPITFFNRYTQKMEQEKVPGEQALRFIYGTALGRLSLHLLIKRSFFSAYYGKKMWKPNSSKKIAAFAEALNINLGEAIKSLDEFTSFNDFFFRKLKPGTRPITPGENIAIFPADGRHMAWQNISNMQGAYLKGQKFDIPALVNDPSLAEEYKNGSLLFSRLCPADYHRFHFPVSGIPSDIKKIEGPLASVSPYSLRRQFSWLWTNKRTLTTLQTEKWGKILIIEVGATCVGSIFQTYPPHHQISKGDEKGYFAFGGSTVLTIFPPQSIQFDSDLLEKTSQGIELYAHMGDSLGQILS